MKTHGLFTRVKVMVAQSSKPLWPRLALQTAITFSCRAVELICVCTASTNDAALSPGSGRRTWLINRNDCMRHVLTAIPTRGFYDRLAIVAHYHAGDARCG